MKKLEWEMDNKVLFFEFSFGFLNAHSCWFATPYYLSIIKKNVKHSKHLYFVLAFENGKLQRQRVLFAVNKTKNRRAAQEVKDSSKHKFFEVTITILFLY